MNQRAVIRYLQEQKNGLRQERNWGSSQFLSADSSHPGRFGSFTVVTEDGELLEEEIWYPTERSTGTRQPTPRTRAHSRGYLPDPGTNRSVGFSSTHELHCALMLMANRLVVDVQDQPPAVPFRGADGKWHTHTFDYGAAFANGKFVAIAVKPVNQLVESGIRDVIKRVRPNIRGFADQAIILTERNLTPHRAWNAKSILRARRFRNHARCEEVASFARSLQGTVNAYELAAQFDDFGDAMNAIWCLMYDGLLIHLHPDRMLFDMPFLALKN